MKIKKLEKINKKVIIGGVIALSLSSLVFITKPAYKTINSNNLDKKMAVYIKNDTGNYEASTTIPTSGYILNEEKSSCNNGAIPSWNKSTNNFKIKNLSKSNTSCYLYFDKQEVITKDEIVSSATPQEGSFSGPSLVGDKGLFSVNDGDGTSYYYRGLVENNYVMWANKCWRIIRFNGDGSIRIIYDGSSCHANGENVESIDVSSTKYNDLVSGDNASVGYMYGSTNSAHVNTNKSTIMQVLETWYDQNLTEYSNDIDPNAGFCNDREVSSGTGIGTNATKYMANGRLASGSPQKPILSCTNLTRDLFTPSGANKGNGKLEKSIGLITADEIVFAGGFYPTASMNYWLYNGQTYWTMSPSYFNSSNNFAYMFCVIGNGGLSKDCNVFNVSFGVRPVINLKSTTTFVNNGIGEKGTKENPYVVI